MKKIVQFACFDGGNVGKLADWLNVPVFANNSKHAKRFGCQHLHLCVQTVSTKLLEKNFPNAKQANC